MKIVKPNFKLIVIALVCFTGLSFIGTKVIGFINPAVADLDMNGYNILMRTGLIGYDGTAAKGLSFDAGNEKVVLESGQIILPAGTMALPSVIIGSETNTGFYKGVAGQWFWASLGAHKWEFTATDMGSTGASGRFYSVMPSATVPGIGLGGDTDTGIGKASADQISGITGGVEAFRLSEAAGVIINSSFGNIAMDTNLIGFDGTANEGWSFDTAGNITFGSAGSYLDMGGKNVMLGAGWFGRAASAVTFDASENVVITQGLFLGANGIGNDNEVLTFAAGATGKGTFAGAVDVTGDITVAGHIGNDAQQTITLGVGVTTFAVTRNVIQVTGDGGGNVIATITGASVGLYTFIFVDEFVTISNNDAHGANTVDLDGANDFGSADDTTLLLVFDGTSWYKVGTSAN